MKFIAFSTFVHLFMMVFLCGEMETMKFIMTMDLWEIILMGLSVSIGAAGAYIIYNQFTN